MPHASQGHPDNQGVLFPTIKEARESNAERESEAEKAKRPAPKPKPSGNNKAHKKKR